MISPKGIAAWLWGCGGRRFVMVVGAGFVHTGLFISHVLSESGYITLTLATVGAYIGANTMESIKGAANGPPPEEPK